MRVGKVLFVQKNCCDERFVHSTIEVTLYRLQKYPFTSHSGHKSRSDNWFYISSLFFPVYPRLWNLLLDISETSAWIPTKFCETAQSGQFFRMSESSLGHCVCPLTLGRTVPNCVTPIRIRGQLYSISDYAIKPEAKRWWYIYHCFRVRLGGHEISNSRSSIIDDVKYPAQSKYAHTTRPGQCPRRIWVS